MRLAVMMFSHETVTFLDSDTGVDDFVYPGSPCAGEALLSTPGNEYMAGFVAVAREHDGVELVGIESPLWPKRGTGSGWITTDAFELFAGRMMAGLAAQGPFDGVYLSLHGAMGVRGVPRPEAELARRVREVIGPDAFIAGTFDPHGNEDEEFLRHADLAFAVKYFPHYDCRLQGERAARMLIRSVRGDYRPSHATVKVPIISPTVLQWTGASPWMDLVQRALVWEARTPDLFVNVFFGFPWADVPDAGMTMQVLANGDAALARRVADDMAQTAWRQRAALLGAATIHPIDAGVALAQQAVAAGQAPVVLADHSDRSGAATWLLRAVMQAGLSDTLIATIADAGAVATLLADGVTPGSMVSLPIGGRLDASAGEPVRIEGEVVHAGPRSVSIRFGQGNVVVVSRTLIQVMEVDTLREFGVDPMAFTVIALKSRVHFRRGFDDTGFAKTILLVEPPEPFLGTVRLDALPYQTIDLAQFYPYGNPSPPC
jgi:microcystin degradation protein MlrC